MHEQKHIYIGQWGPINIFGFPLLSPKKQKVFPIFLYIKLCYSFIDLILFFILLFEFVTGSSFS